MIRERTLQFVLGVVGLIFAAGIFAFFRQPDPAETVLAAVYSTLGVFVLLAVRNPPAHRSLIAFTAWSSLAYGAMMVWLALRNTIPRQDLLRAVLPLLIGTLLIALAPRKENPIGTPDTRVSA
jgi:peptidoglycan/LPS O-acetylase OafA/YrhL